MVNEHIKRCSMLLIIRESNQNYNEVPPHTSQNKSTMRYNFTVVRMAIIKKSTHFKWHSHLKVIFMWFLFMQIWGSLHVYPSWGLLRVELTFHFHSVFFFGGISILFSIVAVPIYNPIIRVGGFPFFPHLIQHLLFLDFLTIVILTSVRSYLM